MGEDDGAWRERAACRGASNPDDGGPDFFNESRDNVHRVVSTWCVPCPVREACLEYALRRKERYGIWGGLSGRARRAARRRGENYKEVLDKQRRAV